MIDPLDRLIGLVKITGNAQTIPPLFILLPFQSLSSSEKPHKRVVRYYGRRKAINSLRFESLSISSLALF